MEKIVRWMRPIVVVAMATAAGCASVTPAPDIDWGRAVLLQGANAPQVRIDGPPSKGAGAGIGAGAGGGTGFAIGAIACLGAGFLAPLCWVTVLPTTTAVGVAGGAIMGAAASDAAEVVDGKRTLLRTELEATSYPAVLARHVQRRLGDRRNVDVPMIAGGPAASLQEVDGGGAAPEWVLEAALTQVSAPRSGDQAYRIRVEGRLTLHRSGRSEPLHEARRDAETEAALTTEQWSQDDSAPLRAALDDALQRVADGLLDDLLRHKDGDPAPAGPPR